MFCQNCGKELEDNWTVCPNCGNRISVKNEMEGGFESDDDNEFDKKFFKALIQEHPVRAVLCIPVAVYVLYLIYQLLTTDFSDLTLWMIIKLGIKGTFCDTAVWLLYGPVNMKEVKEKVKKKPQKRYGIVSHIGSVIAALVLLAVGTYVTDVYNEEKAASDQIVSNEAADTEPTADGADSDMTIEEYLNQCQEVTGEELARNPEQYIGKDIKMEGSFNILGGSLVMNWFTDNGIIGINYDGKAVDTQGNVVGNVITGDYGIVAGRYGIDEITEHPYINAAVIILDKEQGRSANEGNTDTTDEANDAAQETNQEDSDAEYLFPDSDSRYLTEDELYGLDADTLKIARNEIFARHGYIFKDQGLQEYFESTTWYKGTVKGEDFNMEKEFNDFEKKNVALIGGVEEMD